MARRAVFGAAVVALASAVAWAVDGAGVRTLAERAARERERARCLM